MKSIICLNKYLLIAEADYPYLNKAIFSIPDSGNDLFQSIEQIKDDKVLLSAIAKIVDSR